MINPLTSGHWLEAGDACEMLGIKRATLYAYVSRGKVRAQSAHDGRRRVYLRDDLERLRSTRGTRGVSSDSPWPVVETSLTVVTSAGPYYRGRSAIELSQDATWRFEHTCELLWSDATGQPFERRGADWPHLTDGRSAGIPRPTSTLDAMLMSVLQGVADPRRHDLGPEADLQRSRHLVWLAVAGANAAADPKAGEWAVAQPSVGAGFAAAYAKKPQTRITRLIDGALTLVADEGIDAAALATRAAVSAGSEIYRALAAGLAALTLQGLVPGVALKPLAGLVARISAPEHAPARIRDHIARREPVPGFSGPPDARVPAMLELVEALGSTKRSLRVLRAMVDAAALAGLPGPNLGLGLFAVAEALGAGCPGAVALLALGRSAGLIAHALEQRAQGPMSLTARYVGAPLS